MSVLSRPKTDPRTVNNAYIHCGPSLYQVLGKDTLDRLVLENCRTLKLEHVQPSHVLKECELVKAARD